MRITHQISEIEDCVVVHLGATTASHTTMLSIGERLRNLPHRFVMWILTRGEVEVTMPELRRMIQVAADTQQVMLYADYREEEDGKVLSCPCIDYQWGSLRDDFDFGVMVLTERQATLDAIGRLSEGCEYGAWYALRLKLSQQSLPFHLNEMLYTYYPEHVVSSSQFDYVNPANRVVQIEYEQVVTRHLKEIGAFLSDAEMLPAAPQVPSAAPQVTASVVIPVYNRVNTVADAIRSALNQVCSFEMNVIVVDNHSTDGTTEIIDSIDDDRLIHIIPDETSLLIGGCWNKAVESPYCGQWVVQLDSDDVYASADTLQTVIDAFKEQDCMAVVGSYRLTDFMLNELPPGVIDHREWTPENGMNNALRINGLGAPRAFRRDLLRKYPFPNTSYGEDYAVMLRVCREYRIGRIYQPIYNCRRWEGNSDAALTRVAKNNNDLYKDRIRTIELLARQNMAKK